MNTTFKLTTLCVLLGVSGISHAALTSSSGTANFSGSASVTAAQNTLVFQGPNFIAASSTSSNNNAPIATASLGQFNAATGVLTGVEWQLNSNRSQTLSGTGSKNQGPGRTASGSGISTAALDASGVNLAFTPAITPTTGSCALSSGPSASNCSWGPGISSGTATDATATVNSANLNDYVGEGTINASLSLPSLSTTTTISSIAGGASGSTTTYQVDWSGTLQTNYSYLLHSLASFDPNTSTNTLTLDFGTVAQYTAPTLGFSLFNQANDDRIGLDLDVVAGSNNTGAFSTDLSAFTDLAQGSSLSFSASLLTAIPGAFNAQYLLYLSDADLGASNTRQNHQLTLNLIGNVTAVPVPGAAWLFGTALLGLLGVGRRKI